MEHITHLKHIKHIVCLAHITHISYICQKGIMINLIIAGSRDFTDYNLLKIKVNTYLGKISRGADVEIVSGTARGADQLGEQYAKEKEYPVKIFPADWNKHGKSAGVIRNKQMAEYATHLIAFWDGKSRGTKNMIDLAIKYELIIQVCKLEE